MPAKGTPEELRIRARERNRAFRRRTKAGKLVYRDILANLLEDVLDLPKRRFPRSGPAYKILRAILTVLKQALKRGEDIKIDGLGYFKIRTLNGRKCRVAIYKGGSTETTGSYIADIPTKKYVFFKPSKVLLRMIKEYDSRNSDETQAS